jgi:hypothetical protein
MAGPVIRLPGKEVFPVYKKEYARGGSRLCSTSNGKNLPPTGPVLGVGKILVKTGPDISRKNLPPNRTLFFRSTARAQAGRSPRSMSRGDRTACQPSDRRDLVDSERRGRRVQENL